MGIKKIGSPNFYTFFGAKGVGLLDLSPEPALLLKGLEFGWSNVTLPKVGFLRSWVPKSYKGLLDPFPICCPTFPVLAWAVRTSFTSTLNNSRELIPSSTTKGWFKASTNPRMIVFSVSICQFASLHKIGTHNSFDQFQQMTIVSGFTFLFCSKLPDQAVKSTSLDHFPILKLVATNFSFSLSSNFCQLKGLNPSMKPQALVPFGMVQN